jgi:hypothetical protein
MAGAEGGTLIVAATIGDSTGGAAGGTAAGWIPWPFPDFDAAAGASAAAFNVSLSTLKSR